MESQTQVIMPTRRYYSNQELVDIARPLVQRVGQREVAEALGIHQPQVSKALAGGSPGVLRQIVIHLTGWRVEADYNKVEK